MKRKSDITTELKRKCHSAGIDLIGITYAKPFNFQGDKEKIVDPAKMLQSA